MTHREAAAAWLLQAYVAWLRGDLDLVNDALSLATIAVWHASSPMAHEGVAA